MANEEQVKRLLAGVQGWNDWRHANPEILCDLTGADLRRANLCRSDLHAALLGRVDLREADLREVDLRKADLRGAQLHEARLIEANLCGANLRNAGLLEVDFREADLRETDLSCAHSFFTSWTNLDLSGAIGLGTIRHYGPSSIGIDTLHKSCGQIPEEFLRGCGLSPWQAAAVRLFDPALTAADFCDHFTSEVFGKRDNGPLSIGGIFLSYSHVDETPVDKIYQRLYRDEGLSVWRYTDHLVAGDVETQIGRAIRLRDIVIIVLSESSLESDWVWKEIDWAVKKERKEKRSVLCPIAVDDSWKNFDKEQVLMRRITAKEVLDFSTWEDDELFNTEISKLLHGLKIFY